MRSDLNYVGWWALYSILLMITSGALYCSAPTSDPPTLSVSSDSVGFESNGTATIRFTLNRPALSPVEVPFVLGGDAVRGQDYDLKDLTQKVVIPIGELSARPLKFEKKTPLPSPVNLPTRCEKATVSVSLKPASGFKLAPNASRVHLLIDVTRPGSP